MATSVLPGSGLSPEFSAALEQSVEYPLRRIFLTVTDAFRFTAPGCVLSEHVDTMSVVLRARSGASIHMSVSDAVVVTTADGRALRLTQADDYSSIARRLAAT